MGGIMGAPAAGGAGGGGMFGFLGTLAKSFGAIQQSNAQAQAVQNQASAFDFNAQIADMNARAALQAGEQNKKRRERIARANLGKQATNFLASGVTLSGSPLVVLGENALNEALEAQDLLHEAQVDANRFNNDAASLRFQASLARDKASNIKSQGFASAGQSLIGGLSRSF